MHMQEPDFLSLANQVRSFACPEDHLLGPVPTLALTPVADGRAGAYEDNQEATWRLTEKVYRLLSDNLCRPDGGPVRLVVAPEIVYGARTGARAQAYFATQGVCANIWISRSWAYSDELMSACMGIGSSEWQQAAYGLNQTDRPGAVWLKAFTAAMDEKKRPVFSIYSPHLEDENQPVNDFVADRLLRFARCALAAGYIRGKNYLGIGGVSMGIIGSDARRNLMHDYLGMGTVSFDMVGLRNRIDSGFFDHEELDRAMEFMQSRFDLRFDNRSTVEMNRDLLGECLKMTLIVRDLMTGNPRLADAAVGRDQGFRPDLELAQGANAIAAGTQGQRQWTDAYPTFDLAESLLCSSFDWNGPRPPRVVATENDSKNAIGMMVARLLTGMPQLFADIRTSWTPRSIHQATGVDVGSLAPNGLIDKRNSGAGALDYAVNPFALAEMPGGDVHKLSAALRNDSRLRLDLVDRAIAATSYMAAKTEYFPGGGLSSYFRTPGGVPLTAYRYNVVGDRLTCSVVEGETVRLPSKVADHIREVTDRSWPESFWMPRGMSSFDYMVKIGPNHDANCFGLIGADLVTFNAMLRVPVDLHNLPGKDLFRPTMWDRFGGDDFRACSFLGPLYA